VPNKIHNIHNGADTYRVYDPNEAIGDTSPTAVKPPKKPKCAVLGQILMLAIAVAVTYFTAGSLTEAYGAIVGGAMAGAAGSVASQVVGLATGIQSKFSFKGVALAAIAGGVAGGLDKFAAAAEAGTIGGTLGKVGRFFAGSGFEVAAARGVVGSVLSQGISVATGLQHKFNWAGVASAGVGAGVGRFVGGGTMISSMVGGIAGAAAESLVTGRNFGDTLIASLPSIIGNTIGNMIAEGVARIGSGTDDEDINSDLVRYSDDERAAMLPGRIRTIDLPASTAGEAGGQGGANQHGEITVGGGNNGETGDIIVTAAFNPDNSPEFIRTGAGKGAGYTSGQLETMSINYVFRFRESIKYIELVTGVPATAIASSPMEEFRNHKVSKDEWGDAFAVTNSKWGNPLTNTQENLE